jgi:hypothetical protein
MCDTPPTGHSLQTLSISVTERDKLKICTLRKNRQVRANSRDASSNYADANRLRDDSPRDLHFMSNAACNIRLSKNTSSRRWATLCGLHDAIDQAALRAERTDVLPFESCRQSPEHHVLHVVTAEKHIPIISPQ